MANWYVSRKDLEENTPSRRDGLSSMEEKRERWFSCVFLRDLGAMLRMPLITTATAILFCHRFFLRQSYSRNDHRIIATACLFLAGKVQEAVCPLDDVVLASYEIIYKDDPAAFAMIKQKKELFEQKRSLILTAESLLIETLGYDFNVDLPYKPLADVIQKYKVDDREMLHRAARDFVNDGFRTSVCLQFKAHEFAAGAILLATNRLGIKLPPVGDRAWCQELDVTESRAWEVATQLLDAFVKPPSQTNEAEGSAGSSQQPPLTVPPGDVEHAAGEGTSQPHADSQSAHPKPGSNEK